MGGSRRPIPQKLEVIHEKVYAHGAGRALGSSESKQRARAGTQQLGIKIVNANRVWVANAGQKLERFANSGQAGE